MEEVARADCVSAGRSARAKLGSRPAFSGKTWLVPGAELNASLSLQENRLFGGAGAGSIR